MKKNIGTTLYWFFKNKTKRNLVAAILAFALSVTGVMWRTQTVPAISFEEQLDIPYCWKVINPGAKQEIVRIGKKGIISPSFDGYYELASIQEAIQMGATYAIRLNLPEQEEYVAIVPRQHYTNSRTQPIRTTGVIEEGGEAYVTDSTGARMSLITAKIYSPGNVKSDAYSGEASSTKAIANVKINGIKGYIKAPKKATLNAMVNSKGINDERYFLQYCVYYSSEPVISNNAYEGLFPLIKNYEHRIDIQADNDSQTQATKNVRVKCSKIPKTIKKGEILKIKVTLSGSNLSQSPIANTIRLVATDNLKLSLVSRECFGTSGIPKAKEDRFVKQMFTKRGALLGTGDATGDFVNTVDYDGKIEKGGCASVHFFIKATKLK